MTAPTGNFSKASHFIPMERLRHGNSNNFSRVTAIESQRKILVGWRFTPGLPGPSL
jgi:hypothetical protein